VFLFFLLAMSVGQCHATTRQKLQSPIICERWGDEQFERVIMDIRTYETFSGFPTSLVIKVANSWENWSTIEPMASTTRARSAHGVADQLTKAFFAAKTAVSSCTRLVRGTWAMACLLAGFIISSVSFALVFSPLMTSALRG
jgi:hypothetical protein